MALVSVQASGYGVAKLGGFFQPLAGDHQAIFDGMIAAYGRIFLCLKNGQVICLRSNKKGLARAAQQNGMRIALETKP